MVRGELRIYLGAAPGVGKTYAMLDEGHRRAGRGADVVVAAIAKRDRPATTALLAGLDVMGTELHVDAVLLRRPRVALVDELAVVDQHSGDDEPRYCAVEALLDAGIDVLTTIDIGQLESLGALVAQITGVPAGALVPDRVVRGADQIHLVDQTPEALVRRLAHGNIFTAAELDAELANAYQPSKLAALRELTLSWMANRAEEGRAALDTNERWETREVVLVALTGAPTAPDVVRRAARLADRQRARLVGLHVRNPDAGQHGGARLDELRRLITSLGGEYREVASSDVAAALVEAASTEGATQLVVGAPRQTRWERLRHGSVIAQVVEQSPIDVTVVHADAATTPRGRESSRSRAPGLGASSPFTRRRRAVAWSMSLAVPALIAVVLTEAHPSVGLPTQLLVMLLGVTATAMVGGTRPASLAAVLAFVLANWYFIPPIHELSISSPEDAVSLLAFLCVALVVGWFVSLAARRSVESLQSRSNASTLAAMAGAVAGADDPLPTLVERLRDVYGADGAALFVEQGGAPSLVASSGTDVPATIDQARTVLPVGETARLLLSGDAVRAVDGATTAAFLDQLTVGIEQRLLRSQRREAATIATENELRAAILAAVSHDLRTPLATVKAAVSSLLQRGVDWPPEVRDELLTTIDTGTDRLGSLIANLLDMTRLQAGAVEMHLGPVYLDEVVHRAVIGLPARAIDVAIELDERLPAVVADGALLEHVIANLVDNAAKWSPEGRPPRVDAAVVAHDVHLRVVDHGPGIPAATRDAIRRPFQRRDDGTNTPGTGLGLAVADGFASLMGATLRLDDTPGGGTTATVVLPIDETTKATADA